MKGIANACINPDKLCINLLLAVHFLFPRAVVAEQDNEICSEEKKLLSAGFKKIVYEEKNVLPPLSEQEKKKGYLFLHF